MDDGNSQTDLETPYKYQVKTALIIIPETRVISTGQHGD